VKTGKKAEGWEEQHLCEIWGSHRCCWRCTLQMIILPSSSRSSSLRSLAKQEKRGVHELLRTNTHTIFWQLFNMWNITNQHLDFFHCHWTQVHTQCFRSSLLSSSGENLWSTNLSLFGFFLKKHPQIYFVQKNSHNIVSFTNSCKFLWHSKYTPFTQVYYHCIFASPYFLASYQKLTPLNAQGKQCTTSLSLPEDESRLLLKWCVCVQWQWKKSRYILVMFHQHPCSLLLCISPVFLYSKTQCWPW